MSRENLDPLPCINIENLKVYFPVRSGLFGKVTSYVKAVDDISFSVSRGEVFALVGESGCGKTTTAQAVMGLVARSSGTISLGIGPWKKNPVQWDLISSQDRKKLRRYIQIIFQDPYSSLSPRMTVKSILEEPLLIHGPNSRKERFIRVNELLQQVGLSSTYLERYPHEFSGGQRQRIGIARALATSAEFIVADEPVSALDVSIQAQIINLLQDLKGKFNQTMLFISHDLAVVRHIADRIAVMYLGKIVEMGNELQIFTSSLHPYTHLLLQSVPDIKKRAKTKLSVPENVSPSPDGCAFYPRCYRRTDQCHQSQPPLTNDGSDHFVACFNPDHARVAASERKG